MTNSDLTLLRFVQFNFMSGEHSGEYIMIISQLRGYNCVLKACFTHTALYSLQYALLIIHHPRMSLSKKKKKNLVAILVRLIVGRP